MGLKELKDCMDEYVKTLDNKNRDEAYDTPRGYAQVELDQFYEWLKQKEKEK